MADAGGGDDDDIPVQQRASHFNNQRSSHRSSLRSDTCSPTPRDWRRLDDFHLNAGSSSDGDSAASPAPNVPYERRRRDGGAKRTRRRSEQASLSTAASKARHGPAAARRSAPDLWLHSYQSLPPPRQPPRTRVPRRRAASLQTQALRSTRHSFLSQGIALPGIASDLQLNITALPSMGGEHELEGAALYHGSKPTPRAQRLSQVATELYTLSYLIFFAIWGTLARVGLQALTFYPGAPVVFSELWANVAGTLLMGFLAEDRKLFRSEWGHGRQRLPEPLDRPAEPNAAGYRKAKAQHGKIKRTIPVYIGLATGFCGSFTSFSSFIRDIFFSLSDDLRSPTNPPHPANAPLPSVSGTASRNGGYSFMAVCATIIITVSACCSALKVGSHLAILLDPYTPTLPFRFTRRVVDPVVAFLGWAAWLGAVLMATLPPHDAWRGQALFACAFAPIGCLIRYYVALWLNATNPTFPLGTFTANVFGTAVLGMAYDLQHVSVSTTGLVGGSLIGCQALQGIQDGFCGALTTVSTWMSEMDALKRRHAYVYGAVSVAVSLGLLVAIMGSVRWTVGWQALICQT